MKKKVLVIGHADADGHLIAEQTRRNLATLAAFDVEAVVDPKRTQGHRSWTKLSTLTEIEEADLVFFVDMMFSPATFAEEADALVSFAQQHEDKFFFVIDHHPLPLRRLHRAKNIRVVYRPDVFECTVGPRSGMMIVAALCEHQGALVADIKEPLHDTIMVGVRRAAAVGGKLPGRGLLALLRADRWDTIVGLANDDRGNHRLPRGRRPLNQAPSRALTDAEQLAENLLLSGADQDNRIAPTGESRSDAMPYDLSDVTYGPGDGGRRRNERGVSGSDLEAIATLLEVAALSLTDEPGAAFSLDRLLAEARRYAGDDLEIKDRDVRIVLEKQNFLERSGAEYILR